MFRRGPDDSEEGTKEEGHQENDYQEDDHQEDGSKEDPPRTAEEEAEMSDKLATDPQFVALQDTRDEASRELSKKVWAVLLAVLALVWSILSAKDGVLADISHQADEMLLAVAAFAVVGLLSDACQYVFIYVLTTRIASKAEEVLIDVERFTDGLDDHLRRSALPDRLLHDAFGNLSTEPLRQVREPLLIGTVAQIADAHKAAHQHDQAGYPSNLDGAHNGSANHQDAQAPHHVLDVRYLPRSRSSGRWCLGRHRAGRPA